MDDETNVSDDYNLMDVFVFSQILEGNCNILKYWGVFFPFTKNNEKDNYLHN